ncbi:MAG TPA: SAM-dependent methyltransferase [Actinomycetota bacterium]|jgi:methyltransferase (TIGR00027 family)|nr:SAM-dependent methyltransferase [Actinomycetota bacterium]
MASEPESLSSLSQTALGMARVRAGESRRPDRLFDDPYAAAFVAAARDALPEAPAVSGGRAELGAVFAFHGVIRTRFFDDYLLGATAAGCRQVVLLAAGLDTRAFRLAWPGGVRLFELDLPQVLEFKERVLAARQAVPRCERVVLTVDLRQDWPAALSRSGFRPTEPAAWLAEGLLIYLSADEAASLLTAVGELSAPASRLAFEHSAIAQSPLLARARSTPAMDRFTKLWKGGLGAEGPGWLARHGWRVQLHERAALAARYGRSLPASSAGGFVTASREQVTPLGS